MANETFPSISELRAAAQKDPSLKFKYERSRLWGDGWGTNVPLLAAMTSCARPGNVLELGGGYFSTPVLKTICKAQGRKLVTLETAPEWAKAYADIHEAVIVEDWAKAIESLSGSKWALIFVDNQPDHTRLPNIKACREKLKFEFLVTHDTVNPYFQGVDEYLDTFQYRYDYTLMSSNTTVVSDIRKIPQ